MEHEYGPAPITETVKFVRRHEFGDTKYRKVQYQALATTRYAEYFRERKEITFSSDTYSLGVLIEPAMLSIEDIQTGEKFTPARAGETDPATAGGDYVITNALTGTFQRTAGGTLTSPRELRLSFVRQSIRTLSGVRELNIPSTARPAAPKISHVVPIFRWETRSDGASVRHGGGLRVYLERPWWSSGDGEKLGVLVWPDVNQDVPDYLHRNVTMWGSDPTVGTATVPDDVLPQSFPLATAQATGLTVPELRVTRQDNTELDGYFPFVRLALARYQPHSIDGCHLSSVATADFMQLAPDRTVSVTGSGGTRQVYVLGPGASITGSGKLNQIRITVERQLPEVTDPDLKWQPAGGNYAATFADPAVSGNQLAWRGSVSVPTAAGTGPLRLVIEEFEVHDSGFAGQTGARLVFTDTVALP
jgi:hypothetical protein